MSHRTTGQRIREWLIYGATGAGLAGSPIAYEIMTQPTPPGRTAPVVNNRSQTYALNAGGWGSIPTNHDGVAVLFMEKDLAPLIDRIEKGESLGARPEDVLFTLRAATVSPGMKDKLKSKDLRNSYTIPYDIREVPVTVRDGEELARMLKSEDPVQAAKKADAAQDFTPLMLMAAYNAYTSVQSPGGFNDIRATAVDSANYQVDQLTDKTLPDAANGRLLPATLLPKMSKAAQAAAAGVSAAEDAAQLLPVKDSKYATLLNQEEKSDPQVANSGR